jgi:hypothetical protein
MKIDALIPEMFIDSSKRKWFKRNFSKASTEALKFLEIFKSFIATKKCSDIDLNDFIVTLRTHLLMQKFSMSHINSYINNIVLDKIKKYIDSETEYINK